MSRHPEAGVDYRVSQKSEATEIEFRNWLERARSIADASFQSSDPTLIVQIAMGLAQLQTTNENNNLLEWHLRQIADTLSFNG